MENNIKKKVFGGLVWRFAERCGAQGVNFIVSIILARLLAPDDYGTIALITVFINISYVFVSSGFGVALIQKKDADELDFSTVFFFNLFIAIVCYIILFISAPYIAEFYNNLQLISVIRVLAITVVLGGVNSIQESLVSKTMQFKKFFLATSIGTVLSAIVGIWAAYKGFGVWALVGQQLTNQFFDTVVLRIATGWCPKLKFSFIRLKRLYSYGWKIFLSSIIDAIYNNIYSLVIGKVYTNEELGFYNKGQSFPRLIISNLNTSIDSVLFSALSIEQNNIENVKRITRRSIATSTFIIFPAMAGLAGLAESLVKILLTEKWLPCVPFLMFSCFVYAFWPIHTANLQAIKALGRSDIFLKVEIIKKVIGMTFLVITIPFGIYPMMVGRCISTVISWGINVAPNKKILKYGWSEQLLDIAPAGILSVVMFFIVFGVGFLPINQVLLVILQIIVGGSSYIFMASILKLDIYQYLKSYVIRFCKLKSSKK